MLQRTVLVALRELFAERRSPDGLVSALTFTGMIVLLESLAFGPGRAREPGVASGVFWIALLFAAVLVSQRSFDRELEDDAIDALIALSGGRDAIYAGKVLGIGAIVAVVAAGAGVLSVLLLDLEIALPAHLALVMVLGVAALLPVIVLISLIALRVRARVAIVPILSFPMLVPQLLASTAGVSSALSGDANASLAWSGLLAAFTTVHAVLGITIAREAFD